MHLLLLIWFQLLLPSCAFAYSNSVLDEPKCGQKLTLHATHQKRLVNGTGWGRMKWVQLNHHHEEIESMWQGIKTPKAPLMSNEIPQRLYTGPSVLASSLLAKS